jgi:hypothetical protein
VPVPLVCLRLSTAGVHAVLSSALALLQWFMMNLAARNGAGFHYDSQHPDFIVDKF